MEMINDGASDAEDEDSLELEQGYPGGTVGGKFAAFG